MGYPQQPYGQQPSGPHQPYGYGPPSGPYGYKQPEPPRRNNLPLILLLAIGLPLLLLGGCMAVVVVIGDTGREVVVSGPDPQVTHPPAPTKQAPAQEQQAAPQEQQAEGAAKLGETITLEGMDPALVVQVTVGKLIDPATSANQYLQPKGGHRYVAVEVTLTNAGQATYDDYPANGAILIDAEGQQWRHAYAEIREGKGFDGTVTMSGADTRKGVIVYQVPESTKVAKLQFALNSGVARQKGEWLLG